MTFGLVEPAAHDGTRSAPPAAQRPSQAQRHPRPQRPPLWRRLALPVAVATPIAAATVCVAVVSPFTHHYQTCPLLAATGVYCPGCGGLRAVHQLTHGDVVGALHYNAFGTVFVVVLGALWAWWLFARVTGRQLHTKVVAVTLFSLLALLPVFAVVRNLPFGQLLAP